MHLWKGHTKQKYHFLVPATCAHGSASFTQKVKIRSPKSLLLDPTTVAYQTRLSKVIYKILWLGFWYFWQYSIHRDHMQGTWAQAHINWVSPSQCIFYTESYILDPRSPFYSVQRLWRMRLSSPKSCTKFQGRSIRDFWWYSMQLWKRRTKPKYRFLEPAICAHGWRHKANIFYINALKLSGWLWPVVLVPECVKRLLV